MRFPDRLFGFGRTDEDLPADAGLVRTDLGSMNAELTVRWEPGGAG